MPTAEEKLNAIYDALFPPVKPVKSQVDRKVARALFNAKQQQQILRDIIIHNNRKAPIQK